MENRAYALAVGIFMLLFGASVVFVLWWMTAGGGITAQYDIVSPKSVSGLSRQAVVRFRGIRVGKVIDIALDETNPRQILVRIEVREDTPITRSTRAKIGFQGISGLGHIQLEDDGSDPTPLEQEGSTPPRIAMQGGLMDQVNEGAPEIISRLRTATESLNRLLSEKNVSRIETTLENLARSSAHVEKTLSQTPALMADLRRYSTPENAQRVAASLENLKQATQQIKPALDDWHRAMGRVEAAGARVDRLGARLQDNLSEETLPRVNAMVEELQQTSSRLTRLLEELERSPQMLITGREAVPPGPGEQGRSAP